MRERKKKKIPDGLTEVSQTNTVFFCQIKGLLVSAVLEFRY